MEYTVAIQDLYRNGICGFYTRLVLQWNIWFLYKTCIAMESTVSIQDLCSNDISDSIEDLYSSGIYGFYRRLV